MAIKEKTVADVADEMIKDITSDYYDKIEIFSPVYGYIHATWDSPAEYWCEPGELVEVLHNLEEVEYFIDNNYHQNIEDYEDGGMILSDY